MAVDTDAKRSASLNYAMPRGVIPPGTVSLQRLGAGLAMYLIEPYVIPSLIIDFVNDRGTSSTLSCTLTSSTLIMTDTRVDE